MLFLVKNANIKKNVGFVEDHSHIELMNGNTSKDLDFIFENIKESTNNKTVNDSPLKPITFPKRHLPPLPPVSVQNDFKCSFKIIRININNFYLYLLKLI